MQAVSVRTLGSRCRSAVTVRLTVSLWSAAVGAAHDGETMLDPVLLAAEVDLDIGVAEIHETLSCDLGVMARAAAIHDDLRIGVGQECGSQPVDLVWRDVHRSRQVRIVEIGRSQCLDQGERVTSGQAAVQFVT